jgi:hypothetical protein
MTKMTKTNRKTPKSITLYAVRVEADDKYYSITLHRKASGEHYVAIGQKERDDSEGRGPRIRVGEDTLDAFASKLSALIKMLHKEQHARKIAEIRKIHPRAYERWTPQEEKKLREAFGEGKSVEVLAEKFKRQPSAIRGRLRELGLLPPYVPN